MGSNRRGYPAGVLSVTVCKMRNGTRQASKMKFMAVTMNPLQITFFSR